MSNHLTRPPNIESRLHGPSDRPCSTSLSAMLPCTSQTQSPTPRTRILSSTQDDVVIEIPSPRSTHPNHQHSQTQPPTIPRPWQTSQACRQPRNQTPKPEKKTPSTARTALPASPRDTRSDPPQAGSRRPTAPPRSPRQVTATSSIAEPRPISACHFALSLHHPCPCLALPV